MRMLGLLLVTFAFHLPSFNVADSCRDSFVPLDDLESCFVYQQVRYQQPAILSRTYVRGLEGWPFSFAAPDALEATYYVVTADRAGNRSCPSAIVQVGGAVSVPPAPLMIVPPETWFDVAGRRVTDLSTPGVYTSSRGRRVVTF